MDVYRYRLHDLSVEVKAKRGPLPGVSWLFQKLDAFGVASFASGGADIEVDVGPFALDMRGWFNVDHRTFARANEVYFVGRWNGIGFRCHWQGIDLEHDGPIRVKLDVDRRGLLRFPWLYQADWIGHLFVLKPLTELIWARRGRFVLHAAAASKAGRAAVFTGYGSSLKTSFTMELIRRGWDFLGDDQVLLTASGLLPMPIGLRTFDFRVHHLPTEYLTSTRLLRLGVHLLKRAEPRVAVAERATIEAMNVLARGTGDSACWRSMDAADAARRVITNCRAEMVQSTRGSHSVSRPLRAYGLMFPGFDGEGYWSRFEAMLSAQLRDKPTRFVELTRRWDGGLMSSVALPS